LLGEDELARGVATLRNLGNGMQSAVPLAELPARLQALADEQFLF